MSDWGWDEWPRLTHVAPKYILNLFLLETTFDNETSCTVDTTGCTHFGEKELDNVFGLQDKKVLIKLISPSFPKKVIRMTAMTARS